MLCAACGETISLLLPPICPHCGGEPLLRGRYQLEALVGRGSAGDTYRAMRLEDGRPVAIKELPLHRARTPKARELLLREARVLRELDHPAIPRAVDDFEHGRGKQRSFYIVQEFIEGRTLAAEAADSRYGQDAVLDIVAELLEILVYLHELSPPVIHRDLKPSNVIRRFGSGRLVLIDFGSVRDVLRDAEIGGSTVAGTFGYMAPEQFQGDAHPRTDLYGLGALAVHLLTRREPRTMLDYTGRIVWEPHVQLHPATIRFLRRMLQPELSRRMPSARVALDELARARTSRAHSPALVAGPLPGGAAADSQPGATRRLAVAEPTRPAVALPELPQLLAVYREARLERSAAGALTPIRLLSGRAVALALVLLTSGGGLLSLGVGGGASEAPAAPAPAPVRPEEGAGLLALSYVRDAGVRSCLSDWRSSGAQPVEELIAVAIEQQPGSAPAVSLDPGSFAGTSLHACLGEAAAGIRWAALDAGRGYHAKFGLPVWDDPEPLRPWPSYSVVPIPVE